MAATLARWVSLGSFAWALTAVAADPAPAPEAPAAEAAPNGDDVDVDAIKQKYWATGDQTEMGVVQNRLYSKAGKFQLGLLGGVALSDPFLNIKPYGGSIGYHFNEFLGVDVLALKVRTAGSNALDTLTETGKTANLVRPEAYYGGEVTGSLLYGKLSLLGAKIIYYDMHVSGGGGQMQTENGNAPAWSAGLGQRFYITNWASLKVDYRMMHYTETVQEQHIDSQMDKVLGKRANWTHTLVFGIDVLFNPMEWL